MYNSEEKNILLTQVNASIAYGIKFHEKIQVQSIEYPDNLRKDRCCFVTLKLDNNLRGCIGSLTATQPLINDVSDNAFSAAFNDPRFPALTQTEFKLIHFDISVLTRPEQMVFSSESDLLDQLQTGIDGLIFEYQHLKSTYLPSVWESLSTPQSFLNSLKQKAGLSSDFWSDQVNCYRYTTEIIS